jgi:hypothetical protein
MNVFSALSKTNPTAKALKVKLTIIHLKATYPNPAFSNTEKISGLLHEALKKNLQTEIKIDHYKNVIKYPG